MGGNLINGYILAYMGEDVIYSLVNVFVGYHVTLLHRIRYIEWVSAHHSQITNWSLSVCFPYSVMYLPYKRR